MIFKGYGKVFSTENAAQYDHIGRFWDFLAERCGRENLRGLGFNWSNNSFEYIIGFKSPERDIRAFETFEDSVYKEVELPDDGWEVFLGETEHLAELYDEIYSVSTLEYEIEEFNDDGTCRISVIRKQ